MNKEEKRKYVFAQLNSLPNAFQYVEVTNYIKSLEQQNQQLHNKIDKAIELYKNCKAEDYCTLDLDMYNALIAGDVDE